jgi:hypothetical protein
MSPAGLKVVLFQAKPNPPKTFSVKSISLLKHIIRGKRAPPPAAILAGLATNPAASDARLLFHPP